MTEFKDTTNRHLRHKLQSLGRRLDELEEATNKLQKAEDELLDLQDKIIQAEGSNSSLLGDVEALRKRVLKIEGKDEEVRKAEDLCRLIQEKLEEEENLTKELRTEIECLQVRMTELEKLEDAFGKSKSDCTQLCLSLNEERNLTKKLSAELETLKARVKDVDSSEASLNRAEQALTAEMEKLKSLTQTFVMERKKLMEKQREDEKVILKLTEKLEHQKSKVGSLDHGINESCDLIIDDDLTPGLSSKPGRKKKLSHDVGLRNKLQNEKNSLEGQEDNKIKDLTQEVVNLKSRLKQLEMVEADLKNTESKNTELEDKFQQERIHNQMLSDQLEQLKSQLLSNNSSNGSLVVSSTTSALENGKAETEDIIIQGSFRQEKKGKALPVTEVVYPKYKKRDHSPQQPKLKSKEVGQSAEKSPIRRPQSPAHRSKKTGFKSGSSSTAVSGLKHCDSIEEKLGSAVQATTNVSSDKKVSVLSRYPPATSDQKPGKVSVKPGGTEGKKASRVLSHAEKDRLNETESSGPPQVVTPVLSLSQPNGSYTPYRSHLNSAGIINHRPEGHSTVSETESTGSKSSVGDKDGVSVISVLSGRATDSKYPRYPRLQDSQSGRSSTRSSYDEEQHRALMMEDVSQEPFQTGIGIQRVCSPREALCSKVLIKPAIIEYDRKEIMSGGGIEPMHISEKPKIAMKPNKMTSSITFYPNDPSSSRTSSRSSSVSSEPPSKERHTSTSNIVIGPNTELRGNIAIPYEISIPKSEITLMSGDGDSDSSDLPSVMETARIETTILSRSSLNFQSPEIGSDLNNSEPGFEGSGSTTTTVTNQRSPTNDHCSSKEDYVPEMRNITIRSGWRNRGAVSADQPIQGPRHDGLEDEIEPTTTWRAYRATTVLDTEENLTANVPSRCLKPSPAERYMRRISTGNIGRDLQESSRRNKSGSPIDSSLLQRVISHEPICAQQLQPRIRKEPPAVDESEQSVTSRRRQPAGEVNSSERLSGRGAWAGKASVGDGSRPWSCRHHDN